MILSKKVCNFAELFKVKQTGYTTSAANGVFIISRLSAAGIFCLTSFMKVLFLDFDGVLNSESHQRELRQQKLPVADGFGPLFDPKAVRNLERILDTVPDARVVVISSWKDIHGLSGLREMWRERDLPGSVYSTTNSLLHDRLLFKDLSDPATFARMEGECKGREAICWLASNEVPDAPYVIIDDCTGFPASLQSHLVMTDPLYGLLDFDADKAIHILNK